MNPDARFLEQPVQLVQPGASSDHAAGTDAFHQAAANGVSGAGGPLPHLDKIQSAFGDHDVSDVRAHTGSAAASATAAMGAEAYATGNDVAFGSASPSLHTAAHEAAHVVQQRRGVQLKGGVGKVGDVYEQHADAVADRVVAGQSAADLLGASTASGSAAGAAVQRKPEPKVSDATPQDQKKQHDKADNAELLAFEAAFQVVARQLDDAAADIHRIIAQNPKTEAGAEPQLQRVRARVAKLGPVVFNLRGRVSQVKVRESDMTKDYVHLYPDVTALYTGYGNLQAAVASAAQFATRHASTLGADVAYIKPDLDLICASLDMTPPTKVGTIDERATPKVVSEAIGLNLTAALEAARSVRMGRSTGDGVTVLGDMRKLIRHTGEVADLFKQTTAQELRSHIPHAKELLAEVHSLQRDVSGDAALASWAQTTTFVAALHEIQGKVGH